MQRRIGVIGVKYEYARKRSERSRDIKGREREITTPSDYRGAHGVIGSKCGLAAVFGGRANGESRREVRSEFAREGTGTAREWRTDKCW